MAKKVEAYIKLQINAGNATPAWISVSSSTQELRISQVWLFQ